MQADNRHLNRAAQRAPRFDGQAHFVIRAEFAVPPVLAANRLVLDAGGKAFLQ